VGGADSRAHRRAEVRRAHGVAHLSGPKHPILRLICTACRRPQATYASHAGASAAGQAGPRLPRPYGPFPGEAAGAAPPPLMLARSDSSAGASLRGLALTPSASLPPPSANASSTSLLDNLSCLHVGTPGGAAQGSGGLAGAAGGSGSAAVAARPTQPRPSVFVPVSAAPGGPVPTDMGLPREIGGARYAQPGVPVGVPVPGGGGGSGFSGGGNTLAGAGLGPQASAFAASPGASYSVLPGSAPPALNGLAASVGAPQVRRPARSAQARF
jgi:hypothetical protein